MMVQACCRIIRHCLLMVATVTFPDTTLYNKPGTASEWRGSGGFSQADAVDWRSKWSTERGDADFR